MRARSLGRQLLASVSRSFYLTIRILPRELQSPIGLAYLLARASDTIADSAQASVASRRQHLAAFEQMVCAGDRSGLAGLQQEIRTAHAGETELIARLGECLDWLEALPAGDRAQIRAVLPKIVRGQTLDLERFADPERITALADAASLEEYAYLVAGCVGEFWTELCLQRLPRYSALPAAQLLLLGVNFGKGLQLVNILRDTPADLRDGRCYLPQDELRRSGADPERLLSEPHAAREVFTRWTDRAEACLDDGRRYLAALRPWRLRAGCFLPWYLGMETLRQLRLSPPLEARAKIKVSRSTVYLALLLSVPVAFSNAALRVLARASHLPERRPPARF